MGVPIEMTKPIFPTLDDLSQQELRDRGPVTHFPAQNSGTPLHDRVAQIECSLHAVNNAVEFFALVCQHAVGEKKWQAAVEAAQERIREAQSGGAEVQALRSEVEGLRSHLAAMTQTMEEQRKEIIRLIRGGQPSAVGTEAEAVGGGEPDEEMDWGTDAGKKKGGKG